MVKPIDYESKPLLTNGQFATTIALIAMTLVMIVYFASIEEEPVEVEITLDQREIEKQLERWVDRLEGSHDEQDFEITCLSSGFTFTYAYSLDGQHLCDIEIEGEKARAVYQNELTESEKLDKIIILLENQK